MIQNTQGLVLHTVKYAETSVIAKVFTRELGLRSYIIKGVRSSKGRTKQNLLQPLSHLDMTVYNNNAKELQYIKEMRPAAHYPHLSDGTNMALLFFMDEVLYKALRDEQPNPQLFDYVVEQLDALGDERQRASLPIDFLIQTAHHLGIEPMDNYSIHEPLFNLKEGRFLAPPSMVAMATYPNKDYFLDSTASTTLHYCLNGCRHRSALPQMNAVQRGTTLNNLLEYYHVHLAGFNNFKSHEVLHEVLRG